MGLKVDVVFESCIKLKEIFEHTFKVFTQDIGRNSKRIKKQNRSNIKDPIWDDLEKE